MNHLLAWFITITAFAGGLYPIIKYITNKYYYLDTNPIQFRPNRKVKLKKKFRLNMKRRNKHHLIVKKINRIDKTFQRYSKFKLTKLNKQNIVKL
jgi:hypothetical protein